MYMAKKSFTLTTVRDPEGSRTLKSRVTSVSLPYPHYKMVLDRAVGSNWYLVLLYIYHSRPHSLIAIDASVV